MSSFSSSLVMAHTSVVNEAPLDTSSVADETDMVYMKSLITPHYYCAREWNAA
jgi:hypothetical protein